MSDLKWKYPELVRHGETIKVKIGCETKTTEEWLESKQAGSVAMGCPKDEYPVYRAIIQRWHDQHKAAEKAKAEKPKQFKAGEYVRLWPDHRAAETQLVLDNGDLINKRNKVCGNIKNMWRYDADPRPATDPEIEAFRKELAENLGLRYDTWVEYKGKEYRIADHDLKAGKPDGEILLKGAGFNVKIQDWPSLKVLEPKEQVKEVKDSTVDVKKFVREMIKGLEEVKSIGQPKQDGPTDNQVLVACYEVRKKIEACEGDPNNYRWGRGCAFCALYKKYPNADLPGCKKRCPLGKYPNVHDPCGALNPHLMEKPSLTPLSEAVDKAIAELEGKVKPRFGVGDWYEHPDYGKGGVVRVKPYGTDKQFDCEINFINHGTWNFGRGKHWGKWQSKHLTPCSPPDKPSDTPDDWFQPELKNKKARDGVEHIEKALKDVGLEEGITRHQIEFLAEKIEQLERLGK